jgi:hypothetical protein
LLSAIWLFLQRVLTINLSKSKLKDAFARQYRLISISPQKICRERGIEMKFRVLMAVALMLAAVFTTGANLGTTWADGGQTNAVVMDQNDVAGVRLTGFDAESSRSAQELDRDVYDHDRADTEAFDMNIDDDRQLRESESPESWPSHVPE